MEKEWCSERCHKFIDYVIGNLETDKGMGARLRRADNPSTEYQSWEYLAPFGVNLEQEWERKAFATIGAALARSKAKKDGELGIGRAIASVYEDKNKDTQAKARLRRLLACDSSEEICNILRPLLRLIASRGVTLCHARLLQEVLYFSDKIKARWARDFFNTPSADNRTEG